jgi:quercetin dioxygenase-like cupin family protein
MTKIECGNWFDLPWMPIREGMTQVVIAMGAEQLTCSIGHLENGHALRPHSHPNEQIVVCLEGRFDYYVEGVPHKLTKGSWMLIPPNAEHYAKTYETDVPALGMDIFAPARPDYAAAYKKFLAEQDSRPIDGRNRR